MYGTRYVFLRLAGIIDPDVCLSERMQTMPNLSGAKVEIVYTNCDTLAKDESISVYFSRSRERGRMVWEMVQSQNARFPLRPWPP